jgi:hypothetical protein
MKLVTAQLITISHTAFDRNLIHHDILEVLLSFMVIPKTIPFKVFFTFDWLPILIKK